MRVVVAALVAGGCYQPSVATGVPCSATRDCPQGQVCAANDRCEPPARDAANDVPPDAFAIAGWSSPRRLDELSSTAAETDPTISADGLEIVFASDRPGGAGSTDLYLARRARRNEPFGPPVRIAELSTAASDQAAELTGDGLVIYLKRPGASSPDVFTARRTTRTAMFDMPALEPALSSVEEETNPAISRDGLTFSVTRGSGFARELYFHERADVTQPWGPARHASELSTPNVDSGAAFGANGLVVVFHTDRDSPVADENDLYVAVRDSPAEPFRDPRPLAELNTPANESDPTITDDLRYIVFECEGDLCASKR